jgi:hypothetical protein
MSIAQSTKVLDKIRTHVHWVVVIRPISFDEVSLPFNDLLPIVEKSSVRFRGADYPHVAPQERTRLGDDWVEQEYQSDYVLEVWRFHKNGLFVHYFSMMYEWKDQSTSRPSAPGWKPGDGIEYVDSIYTFLEIYEFAARLALSPAGASRMRVEISIKNLEDRKLYSSGTHFRQRDDFRAQMPEWFYRLDRSQTELIAKPRDFAALAAQDFFAQFGLNVSLETLSLLQEKIGR